MLGVFAFAVALAAALPAEAAPDPLHEYLERHRCSVADRLQRLYDAGDPAEDRDRFLVVALLEREQAYVQCLFHDHETMMLCEAASGFWYDKPGTPRTVRLPRENIAALGRLGFSTDDSAGNFRLDIPVAVPPDFGATADLILKALYDGYDARLDNALEFKAPFAPGMTFGCDPVG